MSDFMEKLPYRLFLATLALVVVAVSAAYGALAYRFNLFPIPQMRSAYAMVMEVLTPADILLETTTEASADAVDMPLPDAVQPGLVMSVDSAGARDTVVRVMDRSGAQVHAWPVVWSEIWAPIEGGFPERPVSGMYLHGATLLPDGSLVANFEHQSTFRLDLCGEVVWKLDNLGHHSVHLADDGTIWVSAEDPILRGDTGYPNHRAPLRSWTLQNISAEGEILRTIPVIDLFLDNGIEGLLYMSSLENAMPVVTGDTLHLNDVETFPQGMASTVFEPGDLMISLRNVNGVFVFDGDDLSLKFDTVGRVTRQHDPDFMPGDVISIFDNRNFTAARGFGPRESRIVEVDAVTGELRTRLDADAELPFFTMVMGQHQRLANGNVLVVSSGQGRVLEFTPDGRLAWRYENQADGRTRRVYGAEILPEEMDRAFFEAGTAGCAPG
jgi:hypothetical protein